MKKHEMLEKAMRDYPSGIKFTWAIDTRPYVGVSTGIFYFDSEGMISQRSDDASVFNGDEWAEIIKDEPLKAEKIAVKVNTRREAELICKHKGWEYPNTAWLGNEPCVVYVDGPHFEYNRLIDHESQGCKKYTVVDFDFFCAQKGIEVPKPILTSEDGVDLFEGDEYYVVTKVDPVKWGFANGDQRVSILVEKGAVVTCPGTWLAFSTKEAAEKWIEEQNKPKDIIIQVDHKTQIRVMQHGFEYLIDGVPCYTQRGCLIEKAYEAYKSLQK